MQFCSLPRRAVDPMPSLKHRQAAFADALLNPESRVPDGVVDPAGAPAPKRFAVYRNNVTVSLVEALVTAFPATEKIVGKQFFAAMAREFVRAHPPTSPLLMFYGKSFPGFLQGFEPVSHLPYLSDVAQLEQFRREAYHAADARPLSPDFLGEVAPEQLGGMSVILHPSVRILDARHPALSLWEWNNTEDEDERPDLPEHGESILIARPELIVEMRRLPPGGYQFIDSLHAGAPLGAAVEASLANPDFDLTTNISNLLESRIVTVYSLDGAK